MTVLLTGASGLIGRHTLELLIARGEAVRTFQRGPGLAGGPLVEDIAGDVCTDRVALCQAAQGARAVVHLAGRGDVGESRRDPVGYAQLNAMGALHALEAARAAGASFVLASSQRVYPLGATPRHEEQALGPDSPYGYAKWAAELWCRMASEQFGLTTTVLRLFSIYGPGQQPNGGSGVVSIFAAAARAGAPLVVQSAGRRDFTDARDVAEAIALAVDRPQDGRSCVYNIATGQGTTFRDLAQCIVELSGSRSQVEERIAEPAGRDLVADVSRASAELGFRARIPLRAGLERYLAWLDSV
jgi:UDP-glucose 4-epimerase